MCALALRVWRRRRRRIMVGLLGFWFLVSAPGLCSWVAAAPGDLDPTFGAGGKVVTQLPGGENREVSAIALQPDGKIVVVGQVTVQGGRIDFALLRYNRDGTLDTTFGSGGVVTTNFTGNAGAAAVAVQPDNRIVVAGTIAGTEYAYNYALVRYNADGSLDTSFGNGGKVIAESDDEVTAFALALQPDGRILIAGSSYDPLTDHRTAFVVARHNADGSPDVQFGSVGRVITSFSSDSRDEAWALAVQPDGKIIAAGTSTRPGAAAPSSFALARYDVNGGLDLSFGSGGKVITSLGGGWRQAIFDIAVQPDGKIVAAGYQFLERTRRAVLARYNPDGSLDAGFGDGGQVDAVTAMSLALQPDGKIVVAGNDTEARVLPYFVVARYFANGRLDFTFGRDGQVATDFGMGAFENVVAIELQPDGKIVAAGFYYNYTTGGTGVILARYEGGSVDAPLFLQLNVNTSSFATGDLFTADLVVGNSGGEPAAVDLYVGVLTLPPEMGPAFGCPGGDPLVFFQDGPAVMTCLSSSPATFVPFARDGVLPATLPPTTVAGFLSFRWPGDAPAGNYVFFAAFTRPGSLEPLAVSEAGVSFAPTPPPAPPSNLMATAVCRGGPRHVDLQWRDNSDNEIGFTIERAAGGNPYTALVTLGAGRTSYSDTALEDGVTYRYRVLAFNAGGNSEYTNEASVTAPPETPVAPSNLTASVTGSGVHLAWLDNSNNESGFAIARKVSAWFLYTTDWVEIAAVGPNVTTYDDRVEPALVQLTYAYMVRAFVGACSSGYSNVSAVLR